MKDKNFFSRSTAPYYIFAPSYTQNSGGVRVLYYLCHALNEIGCEAYICPENNETNPSLRTPILTDKIREDHKNSNTHPIAVYPEIITGNPLNAPVVARWILNKPGHLGGRTLYSSNEIIFYWDEWVFTNLDNAEKLKIPFVDRGLFHPPRDTNPRQGFCYYAHKYIIFGNKVGEHVKSNGKSLCQDVKMSHYEIAESLRKSAVLYCYEPSALATEAMACGCPVVYVETPYLAQFNWSSTPVSLIKEEDIGATPFPLFNNVEFFKDLDKFESESWLAIQNFVSKTQSEAFLYLQENKSSNLSPRAPLATHVRDYATWCSHQNHLLNTSHATPSLGAITVSAAIVCHASSAQLGLLANTIDSLAQIDNADWQLIVLSPVRAPDDLAGIDCINWFTGEAAQHTELLRKTLANLQVDWVFEAPAGTLFDSRLFSELLQVDRNRIKALFADDDQYDADQQRHSPRFKPGINPSALMSSDLAGPLCLTRETWLSLDENAGHPAPWLNSLWQVADKYGWNCIKHLPLVLFSLPNKAHHATPSLIAALEIDLAKRGTPADLQAINPACWTLLWKLPFPLPRVQILVQTDGDIGLLKRCLSAIAANTNYPSYRLGLLVSYQLDTDRDPDMYDWLEAHQSQNTQLSCWQQGAQETYANFLNSVLATVDSEFVLFLADELVVLQPDWLYELVQASQPADIVGASPRLIQPQTGHIENCGYVLGLQGWRGSAYFRQARVQTPDDFDWIDASRDITTLTTSCALIRTEALTEIGGFDELNAPAPGLNSGFGLSLADFSLRCFKNGKRMIYAPRATLAGQAEPSPPKRNSLASLARQSLADEARLMCFKSRWWPEFASDPFWNPNLSLRERQPTIETEFFADWIAHPAPSCKPRILAHVVANAQADFRITDALRLLRQQGRVNHCIWTQRYDRPARYHSPSELSILAPDVHIVQNYIQDGALDALNSWHTSPGRPLTIYSLDDVITEIDPSNHFYKNFNSDTRTRLAYALARCDRMVVSTDFLANHYQHFNQDIRVVPNRLEMSKWLHLRSTHRSSGKPRIGWAGGTTHQRDLLLLTEVIERTRSEADWIFFGMCPPEIAPMITEFYPFISYENYPTLLASLDLDIAVAPLADTLFNRGKSNIRLLELGILGLPVVCTDIDPYRNSPACLVKNTTEQWVSALRERIHDAEGRKTEGAAMRKWVLQNYLLENHLDEWLRNHLPN